MAMTSRRGASPKVGDRSANKANGQSLLDRVKEPPRLPDSRVNLLRAGKATLESFGIPPRPDPVHQHGAFRIWKDFFGRPVTFVNAGIKLRKTKYQFSGGTGMGALSSPSRFEKSSNWSGAYVVPNGGDMVVAMRGRWTVPKPTLPPPPERAPGPNAEYACSTWIGLDGQRLYFDSSLPQIGTAQTLKVSGSGPPVAAAFAWFQWWASESCRPYILFNNFPVALGDEIACLIWVTGASTVTASMLNLSTSQATLITATAPTETPPGGAARKLIVSGATAEWIMERPTIACSTQPYWFPKYSKTKFRGCVAITGPSPGSPKNVEALEAARLIRMYDTLQNPMRTSFISMPEKEEPSDTKMHVHYGDF
jgi:Peptidase A4 family